MSITASAPQVSWPLPSAVAFEWHEQLDSTSSELMRRARDKQLARTSVIAAGTQSAGRGRMGRSWAGRTGESLMFSLAYAVSAQLPLSGLSLAIGVAIAEQLNAQLNTARIRLKWPNDVLIETSADTTDPQAHKKLGGILIESLPFNRYRNNNDNGALVAARWLIVGVGINLLPPDDAALCAQAGSLAMLKQTALPQNSLHVLGASLATACLDALAQFEREGFAPTFQTRWNTLHAYANQRVRYTANDGTSMEGMACGVDDVGALLISPSHLSDNHAMHPTDVLRLISTEGQLRLC